MRHWSSQNADVCQFIVCADAGALCVVPAGLVRGDGASRGDARLTAQSGVSCGKACIAIYKGAEEGADVYRCDMLGNHSKMAFCQTTTLLLPTIYDIQLHVLGASDFLARFHVPFATTFSLVLARTGALVSLCSAFSCTACAAGTV